jgi:hypothetical protein
MGWLRNSLRKEPEDTFFGPVRLADGLVTIAAEASLPPGSPVQAESAYVSLYVETMRLSAVRDRGTKYYGSVSSTCGVLGDSGRTELVAVAAPSALRAIDPQHLDRVITATVPLIGAIPYRGGGLDLEIGLFALPEQYLLGPYLDFVTDVSAVASAFLPLAGALAAAALLPSVHKAFDHVFGADTGARLEVGLLRTCDPPVTGYYAAVRGTTEPPGGFRVGPGGKLLHPDGTEVRDSYLVLRLEGRTQRDSWRDIPEVSAAHQTLKIAVDSGDLQAAKWALERFGRIAKVSPGLLPSDAKRLYKEMEELAKERLPATATGALVPATGAGARDGGRRAFPDLADIDIYST